MNRDAVQQYVEYLVSQYVKNNTVEAECVRYKKSGAFDLSEEKKIATNFVGDKNN